MADPELKALSEITQALEALDEAQRHNVLLYLNSRYKQALKTRRGITGPALEASRQTEADSYASVGDFFDAANPQTEAERVLVVAHWHQLSEDADEFEAAPVNKELKNLGHPVSNITRALGSMINQTPRLVIQTSKSGSARQARKRYKVTRAGVKRVQAMLDQEDGDQYVE